MARLQKQFEDEKAAYDERLQALINEIGKTKDVIDLQKAQIAELTERLDEKDSEINLLNAQFSGYDETVKTSAAEIKAQYQQVKALLSSFHMRLGDDDEEVNLLEALGSLGNLEARVQRLVDYVKEESSLNEEFRDGARKMAKKYNVSIF
jgi:hypothetical protein